MKHPHYILHWSDHNWSVFLEAFCASQTEYGELCRGLVNVLRGVLTNCSLVGGG